VMAVTDPDQPVEIGGHRIGLPWIRCTEESYCQSNFRNTI